MDELSKVCVAGLIAGWLLVGCIGPQGREQGPAFGSDPVVGAGVAPGTTAPPSSAVPDSIEATLSPEPDVPTETDVTEPPSEDGQAAALAPPPVYTGVVDLAFVGRELLVATTAGIEVVRDLSGDALEFEALVDTPLATPPLIASRGAEFGAITAAGELLVWQQGQAAPAWRTDLSIDLSERQVDDGFPFLALGPARTAFVGDGRARLVRVQAGMPLPRVLDVPIETYIDALRIDDAGNVTVLPARWNWRSADGGWRAGAALDFRRAGGRNRLALAPTADRAAAYRITAPMQLVRTTYDAEATPVLPVDLGHVDVLGTAIDDSGRFVLAATTERVVQLGYGKGDEEGGGTALRLFDMQSAKLMAEQVSGAEALSGDVPGARRTFVLGLRVAPLIDGRWATIDGVDDGGNPDLYLRLRDHDLTVLEERKLEGGWPLHLAAGGGVLCVIEEEREVLVFDVAPEGHQFAMPDLSRFAEYMDDGPGDGAPDADGDGGGWPGFGGPPSKGIAGEPLLVLPIARVDMGFGEPSPPRTLFAVSHDAGILAMGGAGRTFYFANPRFGFPHDVISVNLPKELGAPVAARFNTAGELVVTGRVPGAEPGAPALREAVLDAAQDRWQLNPARASVPLVTPAGTHSVELVRGTPGSVFVYQGLLAGAALQDAAVAHLPLGLPGLDDLAISDAGDVAIALGGQVFVFPVE